MSIDNTHMFATEDDKEKLLRVLDALIEDLSVSVAASLSHYNVIDLNLETTTEEEASRIVGIIKGALQYRLYEWNKLIQADTTAQLLALPRREDTYHP